MYPEGKKPYAAVAGGVNIDICGRPAGPLVGHDSNPGTVFTALGGVGRNIAHNMALLGLPVVMLTALGDDGNADRIRESCRTLGIDLDYARRVPGGRTSTYLFITDHRGEMELAINDMSIYDMATPAYFEEHLDILNGARLVVADANLPAESLGYLAEHCTAPLFVDPVSTAKAARVKPILGRLHTLKPNRMEAELLSGVRIEGPASLPTAARAMLDTGLRRVFISLGEDGVFYADHQGCGQVPRVPGEMVNTTGCGDAFMAALAWGEWQGLSTRDAARAGAAAGAVALAGSETINPRMSEALVRELAGL